MMAAENLKEYFAKARRFDQDRMIWAERSKRSAWIVALVASALACVSVAAVAALTPLKTVEPFVIRVDSSTGIVDVVSALTTTSGSYDEEVTKYFAARYVRAREGYVWSEAEENFRTASLMSSAAEQQRFVSWYRGSNPDSPQNIHGRSSTARIAIKSISLIGQNVVSVRYARTTTRGDDVRITHWVATLTYSFVNAAISSSDRLVNPLGFVVSEYRADPETFN